MYASKLDKSDNGVYTWGQILRQSDCSKFMEAMQAETNALFHNKVWEVISQSQIKDKRNKLLLSIWS